MSNRKSKIGILKCQEPLLCYCLSRPPPQHSAHMCVYICYKHPLPPSSFLLLSRRRRGLRCLCCSLSPSAPSSPACLPARLPGCLLALCSLCSPPALQLLLRRYRNAPRPCTRHAIGRVARPTPFDHAHINRGAETVYKRRKGLVVACGFFFLFVFLPPNLHGCCGAQGHSFILCVFCTL